MLEIFDVSYSILSEKKSEELFSLRKEVFKDRLDWAVSCVNGLEFDIYDNHHANYLFGVIDNSIICGARLIEMKYPNMVTGTFLPYFKDVTLPEGNYIESSRFFVDKFRINKMKIKTYPVSLLLFLSTINYSLKYNYDGILTIVSHAMLAILQRSGWVFSVISQGISEKNESIYLLQLPTDTENQDRLIRRIKEKISIENNKLKSWPLVCSLNEESV
ncbi:acyl-homoserine-lactone synthase [Serratia fonticola]|uniref:acyl-homoserine-lactone synthase n=1 Tax=Serratia fonticola TaxID=47917 RepID=UPI00192D08FB|nr:acyl-homoserine-lactone synthase [Serratia fonticola]MBL5828765.1 acyl-homoserine-lactone synthase [Serratia fonticola]CAI2131648.1 Acyl-homoserine-lactone synthase [Serratia fonticola]